MLTSPFVRVVDDGQLTAEAGKKKRRRRGRGRDLVDVTKLVAGVEFNTPTTRLVAIFVSALSKAEKAYALQMLLRMANMKAVSAADREGGATC